MPIRRVLDGEVNQSILFFRQCTHKRDSLQDPVSIFYLSKQRSNCGRE